MNQAILQAVGLTKSYGKFIAVNHVDLRIMPGVVHSIIGPNGAGKTTLFHTLTGTVSATEGKILVAGEDITPLPDFERVAKGLSRSFQVTSLFLDMSVWENLRIAAQGRFYRQAFQLWRPAESLREACEEADALLEQLNLANVADRPAAELSHGQQRRLEVGMAMAGKPKILFLDEPTSGMGIDDIADMKNLIGSLRQKYTVLLIEHNMDIVMDISDRITVMQQGKVLMEGRPDEIRNNSLVRQAYLGNMITGGARDSQS